MNLPPDWFTVPCFGCKQPIEQKREPEGITLVCADCLEELYEDLESKLDPAYDRTKLNDYPVHLWQLWAWPTDDFVERFEQKMDVIEAVTGVRQWPDFYKDDEARQEAKRLQRKQRRKK